MTVRYHISPKTGNPNICRAKSAESCPISKNDEGVVEHFDSKEKARESYEKHMEEKIRLEAIADRDRRQKIQEERLAAAEKNWPTPSSERVDEYKSKGYEVETQHRALYSTEENDSETIVVNVMAGSVSAMYQYDRSSINSPMSYNDRWHNEPRIEFTDFGTRMKEDEAKEHLKNLENALTNSNKFINKINTTLSDAEGLYGTPKNSERAGQHYRKVENVDNSLNEKVQILPIKKDDYAMNGKESYTYHGQDFNLYVRKDLNNNVETEVNMSSMSRTTDVNEYKGRIYELRNVLATAEDLKKRL